MRTYKQLTTYLTELEREEIWLTLFQVVGFIMVAIIAVFWINFSAKGTLTLAKIVGLSGASAYSLAFSLYSHLKSMRTRARRLGILKRIKNENINGDIEEEKYQDLLFDMLRDKMKEE